MWLFFLIQRLTGNLYCTSSTCTSCTEKFLYKSVSCLDLCPTGYILDTSSSKCQDSGSKVLFALNFQDFSVFNAGSIGSFSYKGVSFNNSMQLTPLPTLSSGFYFVETSYLQSKNFWIPAPDFTVYFVAKFIITTGKVFRIMNGVTEVFSVWLDSDLYVRWLLTSSTGDFYYNVSFPVVYSEWMNLELASNQSTDLLTITIKDIASSEFISYSIKNAEFRPQHSALTFIIGDKSSSFKGFLSWLSLENAENSIPYKLNPLFTRLEGQGMSDGAYCSDSSCKWPWCIKHENCNLYASAQCIDAVGYLPKDCISCSEGTPPFCGRRYACLSGNISYCEKCSVNFTNIDGFCLRSPTFFNETDLNNPVIDVKFDEIVKNYGGIFRSGLNEETYAPFNDPEEDDPWPLKNRGLFFNGKQFLTAKNGFNFNYKFTIAIWIFSQKKFLVIDGGGNVMLRGEFSMRVVLRSTNFDFLIQNRNFSPDHKFKWIFFQASLDQTDATSELKLYFNMKHFETVSLEGFTYTGVDDLVGNLDIGRLSNNNRFWTGFLYRLTIWQTYVEDVTFYSNICGTSLSIECLWNCSQSEYFDSAYNKCLNCDSPCLNCSTFGTCNSCLDIRCSNCLSFTKTCSKILPDPCLPGFFLSIENNCCQEPCLNCYISGGSSCLSCQEGYFLLGQLCVITCPLGFAGKESSCSLKSNPCLFLSFDSMNDSFIDSINGFLFSSDLNSSSIPTVAATDYFPIINRGLYFKSGISLSSPELIFSYNVTFEFWIKVQSYGTIFYKSTFEFSADLTTNTSVNGVGKMNFIEFPLNTWAQVLFSMKTTAIKDFSALLIIDQKSDQVNFSNKFFDDTFSSLQIGKNESSFIGFLWSFQVFNEFKSVFTSKFKVCATSLETTCTWDCEINQFLLGSDCLDCNPACQKGCRRAEDCNLCNNKTCSKCSNFNEECQECFDYWKLIDSVCECPEGNFIKENLCLPCDETCKTCTNDSSTNCLSCKKNAFLSEDSECLCNSGFFLNSLKNCEKCGSLCGYCEIEDLCLECKTGSKLSSLATCECEVGYSYLEDSCIRNTFTALVKVLEGNKVNLLFNQKLGKELKDDDFNVMLNSTKIKFSKVSISVSKYIIELESLENLDISSVFVINFITEIISESNSILYPLSYPFEIQTTGTKNPILEEIEDMKKNGKTLVQTGIVAVFGLNVLTANPNPFFNFLNTAEIFSYVILFNFDFDPLLVAFLNALRPSSLIRDWLENVIPRSSGKKLGKKFRDFGMETNFLLINAGGYYFFLVGYLVISILTFAASFMKKRLAVKFIEMLKGFLMFGAFLRLWIQSCFEATVAAILGIQYRTFRDVYGYLDYAFCIATFGFNAIGVWVLGTSIWKLNEITDSEELEKYKKKFSTFFEEFKLRKRSDVLFYVIFVLRRYVLCVLIFFIESFVLQISFAFCFSLTNLMYVGFAKSFKSTIESWCRICLELITCSFYVILIFPKIFPHYIGKKTSGNYCIYLVTSAIYCNIAFSVMGLINKSVLFLKNRCFQKATAVIPLTTSGNSPSSKLELK